MSKEINKMKLNDKALNNVNGGGDMDIELKPALEPKEIRNNKTNNKMTHKTTGEIYS